jgi:hypothetical protein
MFAGSPLPLGPDFPLQQLFTQAACLGAVGVWVQAAKYSAEINGTAGSSGCKLLASPDLGFLLRRCSHVVLREGFQAVVLSAELLIQWRALQVVTATPHLPAIEQLREVFHGICPDPIGFRISLKGRGPEEVLAGCLVHDIPVLGTSVVYHPRYSSVDVPVDSPPRPPVR